MPTQSTTYNTRLTDEALEKRFRDTFRSQGGAELVDDLYASGVIIPVVDFTAAAEGSSLREDLQTAWDFSTGSQDLASETRTEILATPGFWKINVTANINYAATGGQQVLLELFDGSTYKSVWKYAETLADPNESFALTPADFIVYLRTDQSLRGTASSGQQLFVFYRQIADVYGNLTQPSGFTSS